MLSVIILGVSFVVWDRIGPQHGKQKVSENENKEFNDSHPTSAIVYSDQSDEEIEFKLAQQQSQVINQLQRVRYKLEQIRNTEVEVKLISADLSVDSNRVDLEKLREEINDAREINLGARVPIPADSLTGRVEALPKADSGIPLVVLERYQQTTGIDPARVEALMSQ